MSSRPYQNMPLVAGDRVITLRGRVEILFPDGSALDLDEYSTIELLTPIRIAVISGRAIFVVPGDIDRRYATRYEIATPTQTIITSGYGTYRADAASASGTWQPDAFDQWAEARYAERITTASGQYLPQDLRVYGNTFDRNGRWQYDTSYGYVWYPSVVPGWRPYYHGYWEPIRHYGWTWIGADVWSWPTHHYGRWGHSGGGWYWIPGRTFGAAWVSWGAADGYVSWCPLGFDNRPVFAWSLGPGYPSRGWVVVPRTHFGIRGSFVNRYAVSPHHIPRHTAFVTQAVPPVAVPRDAGHRASVSAGDFRSRRPMSRGAAVRSRTDQGSLPATGSGVSRPSAAIAVPRSSVPGSRPVVAGPQSGGITSEQPTTAQPRYPLPGFRNPVTRDSAPSRGDFRRDSGRLPQERRVMPAVPRAETPAPSVAPRAAAPSVAPPSYDGPRHRSAAPSYGMPRTNVEPGYRVPHSPRSAPAEGGAPSAPGAGGMRAPQHGPSRSDQPSVAVPRSAPRAPGPPPTAAPPAPGGPSRSGGGEGRAQSRHRGV